VWQPATTISFEGYHLLSVTHPLGGGGRLHRGHERRVFKTDGGYSQDAGVAHVDHPGKPCKYPLLQHPLVSSTSVRPRPIQGT